MTYKIHIINNKINWISKNILEKPNLKYKLNYYWIGLKNNEIHKYTYLKFRSDIEILKEKSVAMHENLFTLIQDKERNNEDKDLKNHCIDDDIIKIFIEIDKILLKNHKIMWCTKAPIKEFIKSYFIIRDETCKLEDNNILIEKRLDNMTSIVMELEVISEFIKSSVDINDQMFFKMILVLLNIITVIGQYYWTSNIKGLNCFTN
jgi:hypothetical protein